MKEQILPDKDIYLKSDSFVISINNRTADSFRDLYSLYAASLIRFSSKYLSCVCDAEDIIQDVFVEFWQGKSKFSNIVQVRLYLFKATKSHTINYIKREKKLVHNISFLEYEQSNDLPNNFFDLHHELCSLFDSSLGELPKECRKIMSYIISGLSSLEISRKLDNAPSTVRAQKSRGITLMRQFCLKDDRFKELVDI